MNIWKISLKNMKSKRLYTFLSILILALSIALILGIRQLEASFNYQMENNLGEIDLVIGAKGSPLQLVLASVLHMDNPTGNIVYEDAKKIGESPFIKTAVPISYGDNYKGYKIVGTTAKFATFYNAKLEKGRIVKKPMEVILGATVAKQLQLKIGDTFFSSHGLVENDIDVHTEQLTIVGIYQPTNTVIDRLIITNLESIWDVHHHDEEEENNEHHLEQHEEREEAKEITSLLVSFRSPSAFLTLPKKINKSTNMQAALPKYELDKLYRYTGIGFKTISWIGYMILVISCITIFISLYKMIKEKAFDLALLRTYGASNFQLVRMITYEGLVVVVLAYLLGVLLLKIGLYFMFTIIETEQQNILQQLPLQDFLQIGVLVVAMVILSIVLAIYPIIKMNISTTLSNEK